MNMPRWFWHLGISLALSVVAPGFLINSGEPATLESIRSSPPDMTPYARPAVPEDSAPLGRGAIPPQLPPQFFDLRIVDTVVSNTNPILTDIDLFNDGETSIAINPFNPDEIVITAFSGSWGVNAPLWHSTDGGKTWTKRFTVNVPPGVPAAGCPCDQTVDFGREDQLAGTFLTTLPLVNDNPTTDVYSATTTDPTTPMFDWFEDPLGVAQKTNHNVPRSFGNADQPWLLVNRDPAAESQDNVYVAYDDFSGAPDMRVAVAQDAGPLDFTIDSLVGFSTGFVNPGHRLAVDRGTGFIYSLFQRRIAPGGGGSQNINYMLNRSTDGGLTWRLSTSTTVIVVANAYSTQPQPKFCTVNALLGGVLHAAVDPNTGDLFYVYGNRDPATGNNRLAIRRIVMAGSDDVIIGPQAFVTGQVQAALPSVAVASDGTVGIFYYTCDGFSARGFPIFTAHLTLSNDLGRTFTDVGLLTFLSSAEDNDNPRQRVLGDYMQLKAMGNTFYGAFTGNGVPFGRPFANHDPIFFRTSVGHKNP
jgi:hypothetical protein